MSKYADEARATLNTKWERVDSTTTRMRVHNGWAYKSILPEDGSVVNFFAPDLPYILNNNPGILRAPLKEAIREAVEEGIKEAITGRKIR